jgi:hypothetical protein
MGFALLYPSYASSLVNHVIGSNTSCKHWCRCVPPNPRKLRLVAAAATAACSFSVKAIDRPAAEFINANVNLGWLLTAQFLTAGTVLVPFCLLLALIFHYVIT